jgi:predicted AlkP superfamily phosphohydrolase/phosphomutase
MNQQISDTREMSMKSEESESRDRTPLAERVLIIGLDGATFDVLTPLMEAGRMPNFKAFLDRGAWGVLDSTMPPITPAAWTTFMTGKSPGNHGILDFERYDVHTNNLSFNSTQRLDHVRTIWQVLGDKGLRVGCVNIPMTYPPPMVNGFSISGFETPGIESQFTYPNDLKDEILRQWPDYSYKTKWRRKALGGDDLFRENLDYINQSFHQGADMTIRCGDQYGWHALMVVFKLVDNLQHKTWRYLDPRTRDRWPKRSAWVLDCFAELDRAIGKLLRFADANKAHVIFMSDHGHGSLEGKAQPNLLLKEWGYLKLDPGAAQVKTRTKYVLHRWFKKKKGKFSATYGIEHDLAVDLSGTQACVMHAGMYGFLYLNLQGRQPTGIVPADQYESLRDEIRDRLLAVRVRDRKGREIALFPEVSKPEELYHCERKGHEWMPDLLLMPAEGLAVVRKIRGRSPVTWSPLHKMEGTHRVEGIFAAGGSQIRRTGEIKRNIIDVPPTVLAMLGVNVPEDMEGNVMQSIFEEPIEIGFEAADVPKAMVTQASVFSEQEAEKLNDRLRDLGYLE